MKPQKEIFAFLENAGIRKQLYIIYIVAIIVPIAIIGSFLVLNTRGLLTNYYRDLLELDNLRVKTVLSEITAQVYNISENLSFDTDIQKILVGNFSSEQEQASMVEQSTDAAQTYEDTYSEIDSIAIYCDNPRLYQYKQYYQVTSQIEQSAWYQDALQSSEVRWIQLPALDADGAAQTTLCLVRKLPLVSSSYHAVMVIRISDDYLMERMSSEDYRVLAAAGDGTVFYDSTGEDDGETISVEIDYTDDDYSYLGESTAGYVSIQTLQPYQSQTTLYVCSLNEEAYRNIMRIVEICLAIVAVAIIIPGILIHYFTEYFSGRAQTLRTVMHQASNEDYDFQTIVRGNDEISEAFADLEVMVQRIKEKDAQMYEARINEKELANEQQKMEFKMLSSQINPHFLYNTLESIRMKAFTVGDKEVANAIKLLGKSMRYVLENMGTAFTTLQNELNHIDNYMAIQKLRFGDKFNYQTEIADDVRPDSVQILPLLLQPIVENALLHGLEEKETGGMIWIKVSRREERLLVCITDNGCGMDEETLRSLRQDIETKNPEKKGNIGLYNIHQRVRLCYGEEYGLNVDSHLDEGTTVSLYIPYSII